MSNQRIHRIGPPVQTPLEIKKKSGLKRLRSIYRKRYKKYRLIRVSVKWLWKTLYPQWGKLSYYADFFLKKVEDFSGWHNLVALQQFVESTGAEIIEVAKPDIVSVPTDVLSMAQAGSKVISLQERYVCPGLYVAKINGAMAHGGTNLVSSSRAVICHDLFDIRRDFTSEELHGRMFIRKVSRQVRWRRVDKQPVELSVAANFVDACAPNYAHWLTEVLPRICVFCSISELSDVPIIVNDGLHPNIMESLFQIIGEDRDVILIPIGRSAKVNVLYVTSVAGYVPFDRRPKSKQPLSHGVFSPWAFNHMKTRVGCNDVVDGSSVPSCKLYLRRNSGIRRVVNAGELESLLIARGFEIVEPEKLSFAQQLALFRRADVIISSSGAALANIIFAKKMARIIVLIGEHVGTSYGYWPNIASAAGGKVQYILANPLNWKVDGIHSDLYIDLRVIREVLDDETMGTP